MTYFSKKDLFPKKKQTKKQIETQKQNLNDAIKQIKNTPHN